MGFMIFWCQWTKSIDTIFMYDEFTIEVQQVRRK